MKRRPPSFRWLVRLLPFDMREAHGADIQRTLRDAYADTPRQPMATTLFWLRSVLDILRIAPRQHIEAAAQDVRFTLRTLRRAPVFALTALLTIALGVGAATAVFSFVNAVLLKPLPYPDPARLLIVWAVNPEGVRLWLAQPELKDLRESVPSLSALAGITDLRVALTGAGAPEEIDAAGVSSNFFDVMGVQPQAGRGFTAVEDSLNGPLAAVLSHSLWRRRFGARADIVGSSIYLDGRSYTVVGVMPRSFVFLPPSPVFPDNVDVWMPLEPHLVGRGRDMRQLHVLGRMQAGKSLGDVFGELRSTAAALTATYPEYRGRPWTFEAVPLHAHLVKDIRPALLVLFAAVGVVLFIACANVAALVLARSAGRQREIAVRVALGASRARLVRQLLTEGLVLGGVGGAAGLALTALAPALARLPPLASLPRFAEVGIDWRVALFALATSVVTAALFTVAPLVDATRRGVSQQALRLTGRSHRAISAGRILAMSEIALACAVLVVAALLVRNVGVLMSADPGFETDRRLTMRVSLPPKYERVADVSRFLDTTLEKIAALPGVENAAAVTQLPLSGASLGSSFLPETSADDTRVDADLRGVTPTYFATLGITLVEGRAFNASDTAAAPLVAIVDQAFARRMWPGQTAVGRKVRWFRQPDRTVEIVGVVRNIRHRGFAAAPRETVYRPHTQYVRWTMFIAVGSSGEPSQMANAVTAVIQQVDPDQPVAEIASMDALASRSLATPGFGAALAGTLAALALLLTTVGIYGLFAYAVSQRRREIGVRLALGASPSQIVTLVLQDGIKLACAGLVIGVPAGLLAASAAGKSMTLSVDLDSSMITIAVAAILTSTVTACWIPARRAARVSPSEPLRSE